MAEPREPIEVAIVDDHPAVREGLRGIVASSGRYLVSGTYGSAEEAKAALLGDPPAAPFPGLLLVDVNLGGQNGVDFAREVLRAKPEARCVMISVSLRFETMVESLAAGARGFIGKGQPAEAILRCLDAAARGELGIEGEPLEAFAKQAVRLAFAEMGLERSRYDALTPREKEVFRLTALSKSAREIAESLDLHVKTVENLRSSTLSKLGLQDRFELYRYALRIGVIEE